MVNHSAKLIKAINQSNLLIFINPFALCRSQCLFTPTFNALKCSYSTSTSWHSFIMRNSKIRPIFMSNLSDACSDHNYLQITPNMELDDGGWSRRGREFWIARRAFLNSYHLSLETNNNGSFKEKLKKSVKEINEAVMGIVLSMRRGMQKRRLGVRAYRVTMSLPSIFLVTMRCFMPWLYKRKAM